MKSPWNDSHQWKGVTENHQSSKSKIPKFWIFALGFVKTTLAVVRQCSVQNMVQNKPKSGPKTQQRSNLGCKVDSSQTWSGYAPNYFWLTRSVQGSSNRKKKQKNKVFRFRYGVKSMSRFSGFFKNENFLGIKFFSNFTLKWRQNLLFFQIPPQLKKISWKIGQILSINFHWFIGKIGDFIGIIGLFPVSEFGYFNTLF